MVKMLNYYFPNKFMPKSITSQWPKKFCKTLRKKDAFKQPTNKPSIYLYFISTPPVFYLIFIHNKNLITYKGKKRLIKKSFLLLLKGLVNSQV